MTKPKTEKYFVEALEAFFRKKGYLTRKWVYLYTREIDLLLLEPTTLKLIGIEVKLTKWNKAWLQARAIKMYTHYSFIALPHTTIKNIPKTKIEKEGIGILSLKLNGKQLKVEPLSIAKASKEINRKFLQLLYARFKTQWKAF